ncbi:MAG: DUF2282 domain-containing protein [Gammaproteobacteria bacterium]
MKDGRRLSLAAVTGLAVLGIAGIAPPAAAKAPPMEKCHGINKAHENDCTTGHNACAGRATRSRDPYAFVLLPKGVCRKIAGGSLKPGVTGDRKAQP